MAKIPFFDIFFCWGGQRLSNASGSMEQDSERTALPSTVYEDRVETIEVGAYKETLKVDLFASVALEVANFTLFAAADTDAARLPFTLCSTPGGAVGTRAALWSEAGLKSVPKPLEFNTIAKITLDFFANNRFAWGYVLATAYRTANVTADGETDPVEIGALGADEEMIINFHSLEAPGGTTPTLAGVLESDVDDTFASPTTRATFTVVTDEPFAESITIDGDTDPITDTFYRVTWDIGGTGGPSYFPLVAAAIRAK